MPLPTPCSVIRSPSHMMTVVPAVRVTMMMRIVRMPSSGMIGSGHSPSSWPERAKDTTVVALSSASPIVR